MSNPTYATKEALVICTIQSGYLVEYLDGSREKVRWDRVICKPGAMVEIKTEKVAGVE